MGRLTRAACVVCAFLAIVVFMLPARPAVAGGGRGGGRHGGGGGWHGGGHGWHGGGSHGSYWYSSFRVVVPFYWPAPLWGPAWWGPPYPRYYAYPPVGPYPPVGRTIVVQPQAPAYVQQEPQYWYYCRSPEGYYPYVESCPGGWMTVVPPAAPPEG